MAAHPWQPGADVPAACLRPGVPRSRHPAADTGGRRASVRPLRLVLLALLLAPLPLALEGPAQASHRATALPAVAAYPSSTSIPPTGPIGGGGRAISLN